MKVGFISLGCTKNLVDTEMAIGLFKDHNYEIVNNVKEAEVIIINTCGFIESAKQEAIDTMLEMAEYKKTGQCKYLIAMGCLVERYKADLEKLIPEVDLFISIKEYDKLWKKIEDLIDRNNRNITTANLDYLDRVITTGKVTAYLKIAEGCSNKCTYCAIPNIRGEYVSRPFEDIIEEAKNLADKGYKEIIIIAQDTTKYGEELYGKQRLPELLEEISKIDGIKWIRFLYAYPESITEELKYFYIQIQHISYTVLKRMNRKTTGEKIEILIQKIQKEIPEVILRTSLIVGFPGETKDDFEKLYKFVQKGYFDKLGVFKYSKEDGTPASRLPEQIHYKTKQKRLDQIMMLAQKISKQKLEQKIGKEYEVLIETKTFDEKQYAGRTYMDIPEEDGLIFMPNKKQNLENTWVKAKVTGVKNYDLCGEIL